MIRIEPSEQSLEIRAAKNNRGRVRITLELYLGKLAKSCFYAFATRGAGGHMTPVGFEPTQLALVELESTPLDHSGKVSWQHRRKRKFHLKRVCFSEIQQDHIKSTPRCLSLFI